MKVVIAPDSFKNSLTAKEVSENIQEGFEKVFPDSEYIQIPMADGGEGTVQAMVDSLDGEIIETTVTNPLGKKVIAKYGLVKNGKVAVIEMAEASGIHYVDKNTMNPLITTTYGTGELIKDAINKGSCEIIIGIGGSATNDGGAGMAQALGYKLLDKNNNELSFGGGALGNLKSIDATNVLPELSDTKVIIASDVTNVLTGENGASKVFGPQKGATPEMVTKLDRNLHHYAEIINSQLGISVENMPGAGAAGGLGAGLLAFTHSKMNSGVEIVLKYNDFLNKAKEADVVITGEGKVDFQTEFGKTPMGVAIAAKKASSKVKVIAIAGNVGDKIDNLYEKGIDTVFCVLPGVSTLDEALLNAGQNIKRTSENIARLLK